MAGGQVLDLASIGEQISQAELENIHAFKTGALIEISTIAPALLTATTTRQQDALSRFGKLTGLAFQVFEPVMY